MDKLFARFANATAKATGSPVAFLLCVAAVLIWGVSGPIFKFSETWQLVINTGTTIITFLIVFLIQTLRTVTAPPCRLSSTSGSERLMPTTNSWVSTSERGAKFAAKVQAERTSRGALNRQPKPRPKAK